MSTEAEASCCCCRADPKELSPMEEARAIVESRLGSEAWKKIDALEEWMAAQPGVQFELPTNHIFTPGLYTREVFMIAGSLLTTNIHLTEHPFIVSMGTVSVWTEEAGWLLIKAPFTGVTKPGTRRVLLMHEDTVWTTFHVTDETDPDKIMDRITRKPPVLLLRGAASLSP